MAHALLVAARLYRELSTTAPLPLPLLSQEHPTLALVFTNSHTSSSGIGDVWRAHDRQRAHFLQVDGLHSSESESGAA